MLEVASSTKEAEYLASRTITQLGQLFSELPTPLSPLILQRGFVSTVAAEQVGLVYALPSGILSYEDYLLANTVFAEHGLQFWDRHELNNGVNGRAPARELWLCRPELLEGVAPDFSAWEDFGSWVIRTKHEPLKLTLEAARTLVSAPSSLTQPSVWPYVRDSEHYQHWRHCLQTKSAREQLMNAHLEDREQQNRVVSVSLRKKLRNLASRVLASVFVQMESGTLYEL